MARSAPVILRLRTDAIQGPVQYRRHADIIRDMLHIPLRIQHVHARMHIPIIAQRGHIDTACAVGIDILQIILHIHGLRDRERLGVDDADSIVIGIVRRQLARDTARIGYVQLAVPASDPFRLVTHLDTALHLLGREIDAIHLALRVLIIGDGIIAAIIGICPRPGSHIGIAPVESDKARRRHGDGGDLNLIDRGNHLHDTGIVHHDPGLVPTDGDVIAHVAQSGTHGRIHLLEGSGHIIPVREAEEIEGGIVRAHAAFVEHEELAGRRRNTCDIDFLAGKTGILGGRFRLGSLRSELRDFAARQKDGRERKDDKNLFHV